MWTSHHLALQGDSVREGLVLFFFLLCFLFEERLEVEEPVDRESQSV